MVDLNLINKSITKKPNQMIRFCPWDTWSSTFCLSSTISSCLSYFYRFIGFNLFEIEIFILFLGLSVVFYHTNDVKGKLWGKYPQVYQ